MPGGAPDLTESLTLVGLGTQPTGVAAKRVRLYDSTGADLPWPLALGQAAAVDSLPVVLAAGGMPAPTAQFFYNGVGYEQVRTPNSFLIVAATSITAATGLTLLTVDSNKRFRMLGYRLSTSAGASLIFGYGASATVTTTLFRGPLQAAAAIDDTPYIVNGIPWPAGQNVNLDVSGTSTVTGTVWGTLEISPSGGPA